MPKLTTEQLDAAADAFLANVEAMLGARKADEDGRAELEFARSREFERVQSIPREKIKRAKPHARLHAITIGVERGKRFRAFKAARRSRR
jgi:hypothetical protein